MSMKRISHPVRYTVLLGCLVAVASAHGDDRTSSIPTTLATAPKIANQVIHLLDGEVLLDTDAEISWESEPFRTAQANRIGIRADLALDSGSIRCDTWWQFTSDDVFWPGLPYTQRPSSYIGDDAGSIGDPRPDRVLLPPTEFSDVYGLRAKVVCSVDPGPDFGGGAAPGRAAISDVKVLLRRE